MSAASHGALGLTLCSSAFAGLGRAQLKALGQPGLPILEIEHPFGGRSRDEVRAIAHTLIAQIAAAASTAAAGASAAGTSATSTSAAGGVEAVRAIALPSDAQAAHIECVRRRWSDGLPVIAPTPERVEAMIAARWPRDQLIATLAPGFGEATIERIATNAVLAGCEPAHLPVLVAAVEAVADPAFNLQAVQSTTNPVTTWLIVHGPVARALGVNSGANCLGQGNLANATLGRALRLILQNIGRAWPGEMDRATHGQPGKFAFCCGEVEIDHPWQPLHVERGFALADSAVTVIGASGTLNMNTHTKDADQLLDCIAHSMAFPGSNDYHYCGEPWLILSPEHAAVLAGAGLNRQQVQQQLWSRSMMTAGEFTHADFLRTASMRAAEFPQLTPQTRIPPSRTPADIGIVVAGGPGTHSVHVPTFGETRAVSRRVGVPA